MYFRRFFSIFTGMVVLSILLSCGSYPENTGKLAVYNRSENDEDRIVAVYAKRAGESGYDLQWESDDDDVRQDCYMFMEPGYYDVKIKVRKTSGVFFLFEYYETGYKYPVKIEENEYSVVVYDGKGIYEEK